MTASDDRLAALFAQDEPPARDMSFRLAVLEGIERRRMRSQLLLLVAVVALTTMVFAVFAPVILPYLAGWTPWIAAGFMAAALIWASVVSVRQGVFA